MPGASRASQPQITHPSTLRHAVHWRRTSYGTETDAGNRIVERLLTLHETCRLQGHRLHDFTTAITANLNGHPIPPVLTAPSAP